MRHPIEKTFTGLGRAKFARLTVLRSGIEFYSGLSISICLDRLCKGLSFIWNSIEFIWKLIEPASAKFARINLCEDRSDAVLISQTSVFLRLSDTTKQYFYDLILVKHVDFSDDC